jgi:hypothetical protein
MKNRIVSISGKGLLILAFCTISILSSITVNLNAQQVEIQGKAKVSVMDTANSECISPLLFGHFSLNGLVDMV